MPKTISRDELKQKIDRKDDFLLVEVTLDQNIQHVAILIYCAPEVMQASVDLEEHLIEVPPVSRSRRLVA